MAAGTNSHGSRSPVAISRPAATRVSSPGVGSGTPASSANRRPQSSTRAAAPWKPGMKLKESIAPRAVGASWRQRGGRPGSAAAVPASPALARRLLGQPLDLLPGVGEALDLLLESCVFGTQGAVLAQQTADQLRGLAGQLFERSFSCGTASTPNHAANHSQLCVDGRCPTVTD